MEDDDLVDRIYEAGAVPDLWPSVVDARGILVIAGANHMAAAAEFS